jgi:sugar phosphate isomerase/epimerase
MNRPISISFSTLGCPDWSLDQVLEFAPKSGLDGIDFRGLKDGLDVTVLPAFTTGLDGTVRRIRDAGLAVSGFSSSITLCEPAKRTANIEEARRLIPIATALDSRVVRVFGGGNSSGKNRQASFDAARSCMDSILDVDGANRLTWALETHDQWMRSRDAAELARVLHSASVAILWDVGHTTRVSRETPADTWNVLGPLVRYLHMKDAVKVSDGAEGAMQDGWRYALPGTGQLPLADAVRLLRSNNFSGWIAFEHEKRWHPHLEEPDAAIPAFVRWIRPLLE